MNSALVQLVVKTVWQQRISTFLKARLFYNTSREYCDQNNKGQNKDKGNGSRSPPDYPEEPATCCMSGCPNCVWLQYAEKLTNYYSDGGKQAEDEINRRVTDPNMKAYLLHELRMRKS